MLKVIKNYIENKDNGLMLLDCPTGFGKTTAVVNYIIDTIKNKDTLVNKIFFVTNLKKNLPRRELEASLKDDYYKHCIYLKPYWESVIEKWNPIFIKNTEIKNSEEFKNLNMDIETLRELKANRKTLIEAQSFDTEYKRLKRTIKSFENKIEKDTEIKFRQFIKKNYFYNKSSSDKEKFMKDNDWMYELYPASKIKNNEIKVILASTKKFFSPIDTFV